MKIMQRFKTYGQNNIDSKLLPFTLFFGMKMAIKKGSTSHESSALIFMFMESVDQEEWE